jgi:triosephosphate isomerase (TIM)
MGLFIGNSKEYLSVAETTQLLSHVKQATAQSFLFAPRVEALEQSLQEVKGSGIGIVAQHFAYPGFDCAKLQELGCTGVIIGHSSWRAKGIINEEIAFAVKAALAHNLIPIVCVGESREVRDNGLTVDFVMAQIHSAFSQLETDDAKHVILAYEPLWAISVNGVGESATNEDVAAVLSSIKKEFSHTQVLYGGSVTSANVSSFVTQGFDGVLVGKASTMSTELLSLISLV